jgi:hypothetical protein
MNMKYKPFQLVRVQEDGYHYIGEVMSYVTPSHTLMVRRVPGHPGTLEEQGIEKLTPSDLNPRTARVHYAAVAGGGSFPIDMLRYDSCAPVNFRVNADTFNRPVADPSFGIEDLLVARCCAPNIRPWTADRWASFCWGIRLVRTERLGSMTV